MRHAPLPKPTQDRPQPHKPRRWWLPWLLLLASCWVTEAEIRKKTKVKGDADTEETESTGDTGDG